MIPKNTSIVSDSYIDAVGELLDIVRPLVKEIADAGDLGGRIEALADKAEAAADKVEAECGTLQEVADV